MTLKKPPTTLNEWYEWAIKLHNNFVHMKNAIAKSQNGGGNAPSTLNKKSNSGIYTSDLDKVLFVLSYMTEGDANPGRKNFMTLLSRRQLRMAQLSRWELTRI